MLGVPEGSNLFPVSVSGSKGKALIVGVPTGATQYSVYVWWGGRRYISGCTLGS